MNGPVAIAGSIPLLFKIIGTEVPINAATIMTQSMEKEITRLKSKGCLMRVPKTMVSRPRIIPLIRLNPNSFNNLVIKLPLTTSFAKPWTIIADDCTPTFPAMAAIKGVKKNNAL